MGATEGTVPPSYCGVELLPQPEIEIASRDEIWRRLQAFLGPGDGPYPITAGVAGRTWAAMSALEILFFYRASTMPGMVDFVKDWLPFSTQPEHWAGGFNSRDWSESAMTLRDLLVSTAPDATTSVLTDPGLLRVGHLTRRGARIASSLLCFDVPPAPAGLGSPMPEPGPGMSYRQALESSLNAQVCRACHHTVDPLGDSLEHFDLDGKYRTLDNGVPVDSHATVQIGSLQIEFADQVELGEELAGRCEVALCLTRKLLGKALSSAGLPDGNGPEYESEIATLAQSLSQSPDLSTLLLGISQSNAFLAK